MKEFPKMLYKNVEGKSPNHVVTNSKDEMDFAISKGFSEKLPFIHKGVVTHNVPSTVGIPMKDLVDRGANVDIAQGSVTHRTPPASGVLKTGEMLGSAPSQEGTESDEENDSEENSDTEASTAQW